MAFAFRTHLVDFGSANEMKNVFEIAQAECRYLDFEGKPLDRPRFHALLRRDGYDERLVEVADRPHRDRDVLKAYAASGAQQQWELQDVVDAGGTFLLSGRSRVAGTFLLYLDGLPRAANRAGAPDEYDVDIVEVTTTGPDGRDVVIHGMRVRGPDFDSFASYYLDQLTGLAPCQVIDMARGLKDEASHTIMTAQNADVPIRISGTSHAWDDALQQGFWKP